MASRQAKARGRKVVSSPEEGAREDLANLELGRGEPQPPAAAAGAGGRPMSWSSIVRSAPGAEGPALAPASTSPPRPRAPFQEGSSARWPVQLASGSSVTGEDKKKEEEAAASILLTPPQPQPSRGWERPPTVHAQPRPLLMAEIEDPAVLESPRSTGSGSSGGGGSLTPTRSSATSMKEKGRRSDQLKVFVDTSAPPHPLRNKKEQSSFPTFKVAANHFKVQFKNSFAPTIYHYHLIVSPTLTITERAETEKSLAILREKLHADAGEGYGERSRSNQQIEKLEKALKEPQRPSNMDGEDDEKKPERLLRPIFDEFQQRYISQRLNGMVIPFDGRCNAYSPMKIPYTVTETGEYIEGHVEVVDPDDANKLRGFQVWMKLVNEISTGSVPDFLSDGILPAAGTGRRQLYQYQPQNVIQGLDIALRHSPSNNDSFFPCNSSFFKIENYSRENRLDDVTQIFSGHYQSLFFGDGMASLNVDRTTKAFHREIPVIEYLTSKLKPVPRTDGRLPENVAGWVEQGLLEEATRLLKGLMVKVRYAQEGMGSPAYHRFEAQGVVAEDCTFSFPDVDPQTNTQIGTTDIQRYMRERKGTKITRPSLPVLHVGSRNRQRRNLVPMEICTIVVQPFKGHMNRTLTQEMIKKSAVDPYKRFDEITDSLNDCYFQSCEVLNAFGVSVDSRPVELDAKQLRNPSIKLQGDRTATWKNQREGGWKVHEKEKFYKGASLPQNYMILDVTEGGRRMHNVDGRNRRSRLDDIQIYHEALLKIGTRHGMQGFVTRPDVVKERIKSLFDREFQAANSQERLKAAFNAAVNTNCSLVIVIIDDKGERYNLVKRVADTDVGILTACIKEGNVIPRDGRSKDQTYFNFLLKLNTKLNGVNFYVDDIRRFITQNNGFVWILGADVTHPSPSARSNQSSVASVTGSIDELGMKYTMELKTQQPREECIGGLYDMMATLLKKLQQNTNRNPTRILFYRDGVSEGYFDTIKSEEFKEIQRLVVDKLGGNCKITFVVVKKRHHTRFLPLDEQKGVGRNKNVPPGTVVDSRIIHPTEMEFFLNSHVGIQGTSKPTRYHVIHDDNGFTMADLMTLTYNLCFAFARCCQPVSYPAPTYYAHIGAFRARAFLDNANENENVSMERLLRQYPMAFV